ncbi:TPA: rod shape-determining protein MreC [candidate division CPR2 bacterium]|uniref:Cell shape-determining protein MreC n=1 Tax=candidate division CPR2 bacterium GW2011_GWC1_41_48 TaxID=1618344 RepID=A0A0G0W9M9_UNCC2|nr:MAG: Cell shape-determining protein MreC [candidate division CPR2 bacterium GW2011_GWC2_39_35]KKR27373.1 MAG: Cell shape-determining protein MreC [candidate division CPR2 bacterium GW2011_GWD2_39_7]KKR28722.1 MAG: Cell shape-determining protein MreC [candidate division CPR2 bacterium GW2011_GWD1_39_7]KKS09704.1 MAG: rod shape-determining protein MreC, rod shape-determining protein MreC [candidate division CPR2 bacterium GW2011_GWC1_41_48]OGB61371.1 MAG: rod shape-determining protein MreC [ca
MNKKKFITLIVSIALIIIFLHYKGVSNKVEGKLQQTTSPIGVVLSEFSAKIKFYYSLVTHIGQLQSENNELKKTNNELQSKIAELDEDKRENDNLKKLLRFSEDSKVNWIPADISAFDSSNIRQAVTINKGSKDGIKEGSSVISEGFLIGKVIELRENSAMVLLVIDPTSSIPVTVQGTLASGLVKGQIGFGLTLENVPQGEKISKGDIILTSGLGGEFPRGLIIGKIEEVLNKDNGIFQQAEVRPAADFKILKQVLIVN